jgi:hypothetical protein
MNGEVKTSFSWDILFFCCYKDPSTPVL